MLADLTNKWLMQGLVRLALEWHVRAQVRFQSIAREGLTLDGALALQLLFAVGGASTLAMCAGCGLPFFASGARPRRDRNHYCAKCGRRAAVRDANRRWRLRAAKARREK